MTDNKFSWMINRVGHEHLENEFKHAYRWIIDYNKDYFKLNDRFDTLVNDYKHLHTMIPLRWQFIRMYYIARYQFDIAINKSIDMTIPLSIDYSNLSPSENSSDGS